MGWGLLVQVRCTGPRLAPQDVSGVRCAGPCLAPQGVSGVRCAGPCLAPEDVEGGTGQEDTGWGLWTSAIRAFIRVGDAQSVEVEEELAVSCSQPDDGDLLGLFSWWTWYPWTG